MDGRLRELLEADGLASRVAAAGFAAPRAAEVQRLLAMCARALARDGAGPDAAACAFLVPGRIEVLGKHTDYAGGRSLLAALERGIAIVAVPAGDARVRVRDVATGEGLDVPLDPSLEPSSGWATYPMTVARRLALNFPDARTGARIAFASDLPIAAGMSSSSALVVAVFHALATVNGVMAMPAFRANVTTPLELAGYLSAVENGRDYRGLRGTTGVGTLGGSEDHVAMLCARAGELVRYRFAPERFEESLPLPDGYGFVVAASGVRAEKAGAARERYNRAARLMHAAAARWRHGTGRDDPTIGAALDACPDAAPRLRAILAAAPDDATVPPDALRARVEQFIAEDQEIIPAAAEALRAGDVARFGALVDRSQELAERLLGNQVEETVHLARSAREAGAVAASAFGAGFGGSVWALVEDREAARFVERWRGAYLQRFPQHAATAHFFRTRAGPPMARLL